jgi:hypothetical protein
MWAYTISYRTHANTFSFLSATAQHRFAGGGLYTKPNTERRLSPCLLPDALARRSGDRFFAKGAAGAKGGIADSEHSVLIKIT